MGYKLAGYEVLGGVEIDPQMMAIYKANHKPKYSYLMGVQEFKNIPDSELPKELFELDILDGSPPCSSFSIAGSREKAWGDKKKFREGQAYQVLDDLFFDFISIAKKLQPKVVVAENVKGLIQGNARGYVKEIFLGFRDAGYECQLFLLNASRMGVPQARERTFFIGRKMGSKIDLSFDEPIQTIGEALTGSETKTAKLLTSERRTAWDAACFGESFSKALKKQSDFGSFKLDPNRPAPTLTTRGASGPSHWCEPRWMSDQEYIRMQTFPDDYNFLGQKAQYLCGMSVPPFMMQRVADQIAKQWFSNA